MNFISTEPVRSRTTIAKGLLRRAFNGESGYTLSQMKALIAACLERARDVPEGHQMILEIIKAVEQENRDFRAALVLSGVPESEIMPESRALTALSVRERMAGRNVSYQTTHDIPRVDEIRPELNPNRVSLTLKNW